MPLRLPRATSPHVTTVFLSAVISTCLLTACDDARPQESAQTLIAEPSVPSSRPATVRERFPVGSHGRLTTSAHCDLRTAITIDGRPWTVAPQYQLFTRRANDGAEELGLRPDVRQQVEGSISRRRPETIVFVVDPTYTTSGRPLRLTLVPTPDAGKCA